MREHFLYFLECFKFPENRNNEGEERTNGKALDKSGHEYFIMSKQLNIFSLMMCRGTFIPASMCNIFTFKFSCTNYHCSKRFTLNPRPPNLNTWVPFICAIIKSKLLPGSGSQLCYSLTYLIGLF